MRITEHLLDPDKTGPWPDIAKQTARKYKQTTGRAFDSDLLNHAEHLTARPAGMADDVAWGFARRAVRQMHATCSACGAPARRRRGEYRGVYLCASCHMPQGFKSQLDWLLRAQEDTSGVARTVLAWHQLPPMVRQAIPSTMWRGLVLADGSTLQYITDRDLESIDTWLFRLALVLERAAGERACARYPADDAS
jgi:hypothetical protein